MRTAKALVVGSGLLLVGLSLAVPTAAPAHAAAAQQWTLTPPASPLSPVTATVRLDTGGKLSLQVSRGGTTVLQPSAVGIRVTGTDLSTGLRFTGRTDTHVTGAYTTTSGRRRQHTTDANQTTLSFSKGRSRLDLVVRVSADGIGYRYVVRRSGTVNVTGEASEYAVPASARVFLLPYDNGRNDYESIPVHTTVGQAAATHYGYPSLFNVGSSWLLVTESDMNGNYGASRLTLDATTRHFTVTLPDAQETAASPLTTPWRTLVVGDLATVTASDLGTDLASPSKVADTSWIRPGRSEWSWWANSQSSKNLADQEAAVDFAARMGWEYITVDAGWSPSFMPTLVKYAQAHHVGVFIWTNFNSLATAAQRDASLPLWHSWGVSGLKIDFIQSDDQAHMKWYDAILAATAQNKLMVEFHGCTIPRGTERTWPQLLTSEAVRGAEAIHNKPGRVPFPPDYYTTLPFARNLAGGMDYTPVTFTATRLNSDAAELAQAVVFESGLQNFADSTASYDAHPLAERFLRQVPPAWDDVRLVAGDPDSRAILARRAGTDWFVGAVVAGPAQTVTAPLAFLPTGTSWLADVYFDGTNGLAMRTQTVTSASTLTVAVPVNGGFEVHLCPAKAGATTC
jgi:alpha-glucosidase